MNFNPTQKEALRTDVSVLIEAGAGSGKTAVLVQRYLRLLEDNPTWTPTHIVAITFTQKAAAEMRSRIQHHLELRRAEPRHQSWAQQRLDRLDQAWIGTIHGYCAQILRAYPIQAGLPPQFSILDSADSRWIWNEVVETQIQTWIEEKNKHFITYLTAYSRTQLIEDLGALYSKSLGQTPSATTPAEQALIALSQDCHRAYQTRKHEIEKVDYEDLMLATHSLLTTQIDITKQINKEIFALMIDEFQDTDSQQWEIFKALSGYDETQNFLPRNLMIVGDPKQAIYGFRGINTDLFLNVRHQFDTQFINAITVDLIDNYRSDSRLLGALNPLFETLFEQDQSLVYRSLQAHRHSDGSEEFPAISTIILSDPEHKIETELDEIARWMSRLNTEKGIEWNDFGILCRKKRNMMQVQQGLIQRGIPIHIESPASEGDETALMLSLYCEALSEPHNKIAQVGVLRWRGVSDDALYRVFVMGESVQEHPLIQEWIAWRNLACCTPISTCLIDIFPTHDPLWNTESGILWISKIVEWEAEKLPSKTYASRLRHAAKFSSEPSTLTENKARVMTIHAAKGLEFKAVVIPECGSKWNVSKSDRVVVNQGHIHILVSTVKTEAEIETRQQMLAAIERQVRSEELRVFYVACTRARDFLLCTGHLRPTDSLEKESATCFADWVMRLGMVK